MKLENIEKGKLGEKIAKDYLILNGYKIIETNYKNKIGEIDIIALDGDVLTFIEVKSRTTSSYGYPYEAVNFKKQKKIMNVSMIYIKHKKLSDIQLRYDIIEVYLTKTDKINHIKDAFCL